MKTDILKRIAKHTRAIPEKVWGFGEWKKEEPCGTVCCAIGNAIEKKLVPGLTFTMHWQGTNEEGEVITRYLPTFNGFLSGRAVAEALSIPQDDVEYLFYPSEYPQSVTPVEVADRIIQYVKDHA